MPSAPPRVEPLSPLQAAAARRLRLLPAQAVYAGDIAFHVDNALQAPDSEAMAVLVDATVVGFYRLDFPTARGPAAEADTRRSVTLRAFALDTAWQGRGLGLPVLTACCADLEHRHPTRDALTLTVDCANTVAVRLYRRAGFSIQTTLPGGRAGPQYLMRRPLGMGQCRP